MEEKVLLLIIMKLDENSAKHATGETDYFLSLFFYISKLETQNWSSYCSAESNTADKSIGLQSPT